MSDYTRRYDFLPATVAKSGEVDDEFNDIAAMSATKFDKSGGTITGFVIIADGAGEYLRVPSLTTAERNALTPAAGMIIYNSTTTQIERYQAGAWGAFGPDATITTADHKVGASTDATLVSYLAAKDAVGTINGTAVEVVASASDPRRCPIVNGKARVNTATVSTTLSGAAGARYIFSDSSAAASTFTLANSTSATPGADQTLIKVAYWDGAAITHVFTVGKASVDYKVTFGTQRTTTSTTYVDTGDSVVFVSDGVTPQEISALALLGQNAASGRAYIGVVVDSTTEIELEYMCPVTGDGDATQSTGIVKVFSAGAHTMKLQLKQANAGTAMINAHVVPTRLAIRQNGG